MSAAFLWGMVGALLKITYSQTTIAPVSMAWFRLIFAIPFLGAFTLIRRYQVSLKMREVALFVMFGLFSALPLGVLVYDSTLSGVLLSFGLWTFLPLGEDISWYHFAGTWPGPEDWTSWGGGYSLGRKWLPRWYLLNGILTIVFYGFALGLS